MASTSSSRELASPASAGARLRQRIFRPWSSSPRAVSTAVVVAPKRQIGFQASIAEFLLINRLRARRRAEPSADVLERAARIVFITCQHWFAPTERDNVGHRTRL